MKFGISMNTRGPTARPENTTLIARRAEEAGFHEAVLGDHIVFPNNIASKYPYNPEAVHPGSVEGETLECLTLLTYIAAKTERLRIVTGVMITPNRHPIIAAKALATMDYLSNGRVTLGLGAGWMREEFETLGLPPYEERGEVTNEYIRAMRELWTSPNPRFEGKYVRFSDIRFYPKPVQKPHLPIWIGGESPPAMRRAATLGNGWHPIGLNPQHPLETASQMKAAIEKLGAMARKAGRALGEIEVAYRVPKYELLASGHPKPFRGTAEDVAQDIREFASVGVGHLVLDMRTNDVKKTLSLIEGFATKVMPLVK
ncbi:MAG: LLM class F420-dependent oxidoreductase [SAR202 cluster bacterium]|nr:LLM class F420-dependent oxidoreductase [SAR202 cluster bacterium]